MLIVDVHDPSQPTLMTAFSTPGETHKVLVHDDLIYLAMGQAGLGVVDVTQPLQPIWTDYGLTSDQTRSIAIAKENVFVASRMGGLSILNRGNQASIANH